MAWGTTIWVGRLRLRVDALGIEDDGWVGVEGSGIGLWVRVVSRGLGLWWRKDNGCRERMRLGGRLALWVLVTAAWAGMEIDWAKV